MNNLDMTKIQKSKVYLFKFALLVVNICSNAVKIFKNNTITIYIDADINRMNFKLSKDLESLLRPLDP